VTRSWARALAQAQKGKFGWLFKDAYDQKEKKQAEEARLMHLQNNGTAGAEGGDAAASGGDADVAAAANAVDALRKKDKADEAKALEFSKGQEGVFIGGLLLSVVLVFALGFAPPAPPAAHPPCPAAPPRRLTARGG